jgi:hypothetical protein
MKMARRVNEPKMRPSRSAQVVDGYIALLDILDLRQAFGRGIEKLAVVGQKCSDCTWDLLALLYQRTAFFQSDRLEQAWL